MILRVIGAILTFPLFVANVHVQAQELLPIRAMSFNIRYDTESDGEHAWRHRLERAATTIRYHRPDVLGVQEALLNQLHDLEGQLADYQWVGVGRDDANEGGEFSAIFYRADRVLLQDSGTFWLSETPEVPGSIGWDAAITRIVTWAKFEDQLTGTTFYHFNTHFDHIGEEARFRSARQLVERIRDRGDDAPVIVTGDMNATPTSRPYAVLSDALLDAREISAEPPHGPDGTMSGFEALREPRPRIDYVFVTSDSDVQRFATLAEHWEGRHASDHFAVVADVLLPQER